MVCHLLDTNIAGTFKFWKSGGKQPATSVAPEIIITIKGNRDAIRGGHRSSETGIGDGMFLRGCSQPSRNLGEECGLQRQGKTAFLEGNSLYDRCRATSVGQSTTRQLERPNAELRTIANDHDGDGRRGSSEDARPGALGSEQSEHMNDVGTGGNGLDGRRSSVKQDAFVPDGERQRPRVKHENTWFGAHTGQCATGRGRTPQQKNKTEEKNMQPKYRMN